MPVIQVFEHERLRIFEDDFGRCISQKQLNKLLEFNDNNDHKYFTPIRSGIKFTNYVGVIRIGNLTIEILPKADKTLINTTNKEVLVTRWRNVLLKMLAKSGYLQIDTVSDSLLRKRHNSILHLYFQRYVKEIEKIIRHGLTKKYHEESKSLTSLKGRLHFAKNIQKNLVHQERFFTTHQCYDYDHLINQILIKGLIVLKRLMNDELLTDQTNQLLFKLPEEISEKQITPESFDMINMNRKTEIYSEAIKIAKMLILNYSPDISHGEDDMIALLFDMNRLWEKYIYKMLKSSEDDSYTVNFKESEHFWETRPLYPDLVIRQGTKVTIMDTKWRLAYPNKPKNDELKQMFAYNIYWNSQNAILLFPKTDYEDGEYGKFHKGQEKGHHCKVAFIDVMNEKGDLNQDIGKQIVEKI